MINNVKGQAVNSEEKEFTAFLVNILQASDVEDFERKMSQISQDELKELYRQFKTDKQKKINKAMDGAKLNLLEKINNRCPEGMEMFLAGGCIKCRKKKDNDFGFKESAKRFAKGPTDGNSTGETKMNERQRKALVNKHQDGGKSNVHKYFGGSGPMDLTPASFYPELSFSGKRRLMGALTNEVEKTREYRKNWNDIKLTPEEEALLSDINIAANVIQQKDPLIANTEKLDYSVRSPYSTSRISIDPVQNGEQSEEVTVATPSANETTIITEKPKTFPQAFAEAKKAGLDVFEWNGRKFSTETKEEKEAKLRARQAQVVEPSTTRFKEESVVSASPEEGSTLELHAKVNDLVDQIASLIRPEGADNRTPITRKEQRGLNRQIRQDRRYQNKQARLSALSERYNQRFNR